MGEKGSLGIRGGHRPLAPTHPGDSSHADNYDSAQITEFRNDDRARLATLESDRICGTLRRHGLPRGALTATGGGGSCYCCCDCEGSGSAGWCLGRGGGNEDDVMDNRDCGGRGERAWCGAPAQSAGTRRATGGPAWSGRARRQ
ncbi:hypothetical protein OsJ_29418 [Oryza sativa Japonica Group]|uniref:Uncharacterized protein n=1 Tax=Oryza sativa subsp. japonica TaxID=39947 RepID=B9G3N5_ORYSJ|nr:hypothetical protein OsJ_29418 [Oryza sativa Japonica Group]